MFPFLTAMGRVRRGGFGGGLDPAAASANAALSNNNTRASGTVTLSWSAARSAVGPSSGKVYFEATIVSGYSSAVDVGVGFAQSTDLMNGFWNAASGNAALRGGGSGGAVAQYNNGNSAMPQWDVGQTAGFAMDIDAGKVWFRTPGGVWNNSGLADPATGAGAFTIAPTKPVFAAVELYRIGSVVDVNFGGSSFVFTPPAGFLSA